VIVRYEGITELVGDLLLQCTGGQPTPVGQPIPAQNVTLTLNTNVTSPLLGSGYIDALLLIDDPYPSPGNAGLLPGTTATAPNTAADNPPSVGIPANSPTQSAICQVATSPVSGQCNYLKGTFDGTHSTAYGSPYSPYLQPGAYTMYGGRPTSISGTISGNQVTWLGVPIDAPGTVGVRVVRLTNVRANACQLGLSSTLIPTQIVGFVSITGAQFVTINNPQQTLAYIQQGLFVSGPNSTLNQCTNLNVGGAGGIGGNVNGSSGIEPVTSITLREGFAQSFKRRNYTKTNPISPTTGGNYFGYTLDPQNIPGYAYNTESAFEPSNDGSTYIAYPLGGSTPGQASTGTRFLLRFNNIGAGAQLQLPNFVPLVTGGAGCPEGNPNPPSSVPSGGACGGTWTGGYLQLVGTSDLNGNVGTFSNAFPGGTFFNGGTDFIGTPTVSSGFFSGASNITFTAPTAAAVYEVINSDPSAIESATIQVGVAFTSNTPNNLPALGQVTVNASFAPLSTVGNAATLSNSAPVPRFCDKSTAQNTFSIGQCVCNLLFPFVTQAPGFDTGIAIANTSLDNINGVTPQTGTVRMDFYGTTTGGAAVSPASLQSQTTTAPVPAGQVLTFTLFGGAGANAAGLQAVPGFTGYIVARANFQWCHGFAFISDLGAQKLAEGYLAIELDQYAGEGLNRTSTVGEVQGH
jgi:hypothetical protein